jgi:hypothetical protein
VAAGTVSPTPPEGCGGSVSPFVADAGTLRVGRGKSSAVSTGRGAVMSVADDSRVDASLAVTGVVSTLGSGATAVVMRVPAGSQFDRTSRSELPLLACEIRNDW